ncbi:pentapeptide repeat-containing protein [Butyricicoccus sp. 1XD8-22]|nr:pentapeptide repeat-containing protein [Butyricicoccus sp. 1XD8-22]
MIQHPQGGLVLKKKKQGIDPDALFASRFSAFPEWIKLGEYDFEDLLFSDDEIKTENLYGLTFTRCIFRRCRMSQAQFGTVRFEEVVFEDCDCPGARFSDSSWLGCTLSGCRLVGAKLSGARFRKVRFQDCAAKYANFDRAAFTNVSFDSCGFQDAYFRACRFKDQTISGCSFLLANFCQTSLAGLDFTTSEIGGWTLSEGVAELRGAVVTPVQAVELAERCGLVVKSPEGLE